MEWSLVMMSTVNILYYKLQVILNDRCLKHCHFSEDTRIFLAAESIETECLRIKRSKSANKSEIEDRSNTEQKILINKIKEIGIYWRNSHMQFKFIKYYYKVVTINHFHVFITVHMSFNILNLFDTEKCCSFLWLWHFRSMATKKNNHKFKLYGICTNCCLRLFQLLSIPIITCAIDCECLVKWFTCFLSLFSCRRFVQFSICFLICSGRFSQL